MVVGGGGLKLLTQLISRFQNWELSKSEIEGADGGCYIELQRKRELRIGKGDRDD